uniref:Uncharacterized protein n=1 Tax=Arundo donax TaxID=35708 RepID=A0A0A9CJK4_ARUDO
MGVPVLLAYHERPFVVPQASEHNQHQKRHLLRQPNNPTSHQCLDLSTRLPSIPEAIVHLNNFHQFHYIYLDFHVQFSASSFEQFYFHVQEGSSFVSCKIHHHCC